MKHLSKKIISLVLSLIMLLSMTTISVSANELITIEVDNEYECVVREVTEHGITVATVDKTSNILTVEKYNATGVDLISVDTVDLNTAAEQFQIDEDEPQGPRTRAYTYQNTFSNREYEYWTNSYVSGVGNCIRWNIRKDSSYKNDVAETTNNQTTLKNFRDSVEAVNSNEYALIAAVGVGSTVTIITAIFTGGAAAGIAAATTVGASTTVALNLNTSINNADYYFDRVTYK